MAQQFKSELQKVSSQINEENIIDDTIFELASESEIDTLFRLYDKIKDNIPPGKITKNEVNGIVVENQAEYKTHAYLVANSKNYLEGNSFQYSSDDVALLLAQLETLRNRVVQLNDQVDATVKIINSYSGVLAGTTTTVTDLFKSGDNINLYSQAVINLFTNLEKLNATIISSGINAFLLENQNIDLKTFNTNINQTPNSITKEVE